MALSLSGLLSWFVTETKQMPVAAFFFLPFGKNTLVLLEISPGLVGKRYACSNFALWSISRRERKEWKHFFFFFLPVAHCEIRSMVDRSSK